MRRLTVLISCFMVALLVSPLSSATRRPHAAGRGVGPGAPPAPRALAAPPAQDAAGDPATLVGTGQGKAGVGFAEPKAEVNESAVGSQDGMSAELMEERAEQEEHEEPSAEASLPQGPSGPAASIEPPTSSASE